MRTIYLDADYMCHLEDAQGRTPIETDVFDGAVDATIPYYRYIPQGEEYTDDKGRVFYGMFVQAMNSTAIDSINRQAMFVDMQNALALLGVTE